MNILCKFLCNSTEEHANNGAECDKTYSAEFYPVHSGSPENEEFFRYTPSGTLRLDGLKSQPFEAGQEYYVELKPVLANPVAPPGPEAPLPSSEPLPA